MATDDELIKGAEAIKTLVKKHPAPARPPGWGEIGPYGLPNEFDITKVALDAVLPTHDQDLLNKKAEVIDYIISLPDTRAAERPGLRLAAIMLRNHAWAAVSGPPINTSNEHPPETPPDIITMKADPKAVTDIFDGGEL